MSVGYREVEFPNGNRSVVVRARSGDRPQGLLAAAGMSVTVPRPVLVVCGGASDLKGEQLLRTERTLGPVVTTAARLTGAAVIDGGTDAGVMRVVGGARSATDEMPVLIGVAPAGLVALPGEPDNDARLEPHHSHIVLADCGAWGCETPLLVELASALAGGGALAMVVAGGGDVTRTEVTEASRHGWPIFVLTGTGGAADELAVLWRRHRERRVRRLAPALPERFRYRSQPPVSEIADAALRDVVARGDVRVAAEGEPAALANRLAWELHGDETLKAAWQKFATYDRLANSLRRSFERFQAAILIAGILATLLALIQSAIKSPVLHWVVIALPIAGSVLIAIANRRSAGKRWVMLRGAAESLKSEIYRYRARSRPYQAGANRAGTLATRVDWVVAALIRTEASSGPLTPYTGPLPPKMYGAASDDGITPLDPERYLKTRVAAQLDYYHGRTRRLDRRRSQLQLIAISAGGAGAILAAAGVEEWIGLTTTIAVAGFSFLGSLQVDSTIVAYNQAAGRLETLRDGWNALRPDARTRAAFRRLVNKAEEVLTTELGGWVEQMNESIRQQQESQLERVREVDPPGGETHMPG